jgi:hypothetical protein
MKQSYADRLQGLSSFAPVGEDAHVEYAVIDRAGRVQIPREYLERIQLGDNKLQVSMGENNKIVLSAPEMH